MSDISISIPPTIITSSSPDVSINNDMKVFLSPTKSKAGVKTPQPKFKTLIKTDVAIDIDSVFEIYMDGSDYIKMEVDSFPEYSTKTLSSDYPKWNSFSFKFDKGTDAIMTMKGWTEKTKKMLTSAKVLINKVRGVVSLLNELLSFYEDTFKAFIKIFIKQLDRLITDVKSTGIYFLDMTSYHLKETNESRYNERQFIGPWWDWSGDSVEDVEQLEKKTKKENKTNTEIMGDILQDVFQYKAETYEEYIDRICYHFTNPNDRIEHNSKFISPLEDERSPWSIFSEGGISNFRTGTPDFGPNGKMKVVILTAVFPDLSKIFDFFLLLCGHKNVNGQIEFNPNGNNLIGELFGGASEVVKKAAETYQEVINSGIIDFNYGKYNERKILEESDPYWIGLTLGNLFPFVFDKIDEALAWLNGLAFTVDKGILDAIEDTLRSMVEEIEKLIRLIDLINQILDFINALFNVPTIGILNLDINKGGTSEAVRLIKESVGFFGNAEKYIKEVDNMQNHFIDKMIEQKTKYEYYEEKTKKTELTTKAINQFFSLWNKRYEVLLSIYNYVIQHDFVTLYNNMSKNALFISYTNQIKSSIDPVEINNIKELRDSLNVVIIWNNEFDILYKMLKNLEWPKSDAGDIITKVSQVNSLITNEYMKTYSINMINYNNSIKFIVDNGYQAIDNSSDYVLNMIYKLNKEINNIYFEDDKSSKILYYEDMLKTNRKNAKDYVDRKIKENREKIEKNKQVSNLFDPEEKMYYAGIALVAGIPGGETKKYFDFDEFNKNIIDQNQEYKDEWKKQKNDINKAWDALSDFFR